MIIIFFFWIAASRQNQYQNQYQNLAAQYAAAQPQYNQQPAPQPAPQQQYQPAPGIFWKVIKLSEKENIIEKN